MDFNKLTLKSQEAVGSAQELARRLGSPELYPEHLLLTLLDQELPQQLVQLARLRERLAERGIELELTEGATAAIAEAGWDPSYGARPLKRAIQRLLENPLALRLLEGDLAEGDTVRVDAADGALVFEPAEPVQRAAV